MIVGFSYESKARGERTVLALNLEHIAQYEVDPATFEVRRTDAALRHLTYPSAGLPDVIVSPRPTPVGSAPPASARFHPGAASGLEWTATCKAMGDLAQEDLVSYPSLRLDRKTMLCASCALSLVLAACGEEVPPTAPVTAPVVAPAAALWQGGAASPVCPAHPDYVVDDAGGLAVAQASAAPGSMIALRGMVALPWDFEVVVDGLRLTCAEPGAGLRAEPNSVGYLVHVAKAKNVTVDHLVLDAREASGGAILTGTDVSEGSFSGDGARFVSNRVMCGPGDCAFFQSPVHALGDRFVIEGNDITATGSAAGIHVQGVRNVRVAQNTVRREGSGGAGILVNGVEDIQLVDNDITGPWSLGVHLLDGVYRGRITRNRVRGSELRGLLMNGVEDLTIDQNDVECGSQSCGRFSQLARLKVVENRFRATAALAGLFFFNGVEAIDVSRNQVSTTEPSTNSTFGAIRLVGTSGARIVANVIDGPWLNGLALTQVSASDISSNRVSAAVEAGALLFQGDHNTLSGNELNTEDLGLWLDGGCYNRLLGNRGDQGSGPFIGLGDDTGATHVVLPSSALTWLDLGTLDCDGDGTADPNTILGGTPYI